MRKIHVLHVRGAALAKLKEIAFQKYPDLDKPALPANKKQK